MKKNDISGLKKNRPMAMKFGFIFSLGFVLMAFSYSVPHSKNKVIYDNQPVLVDEEIEVRRTKHPERQPPPKFDLAEKFETVEELIINDPEEPQSISIDIDDDLDIDFKTDGLGNDDPEIEPEVDEEPLDILIEEPPRDFAEYMPSFGNCNVSEMTKEEYKSCSDAALLTYFARNIKYPSMARENNVEGRVILRFVVDEKGDVILPKVIKGVPAGCSQEALRVLSEMPRWKPGRHGGRNVKVYYTLPVMFKLKD